MELRFFVPGEIDMDMLSPPIHPVMRKYLKEVLSAIPAGQNTGV